MKIAHHPDPSTLLSYGAGCLAEALSGVAAAHIELCHVCQQDMDILETMGGALLSTIQPVQITGSMPALTLRRVEAQVMEERTNLFDSKDGTIPATLAQFVGTSLEEIVWQRSGRGIWLHDITIAGKSLSALRLIKMSRARPVPPPKYGGSDLTMVLSGFLHDDNTSFGPGDVIDQDPRARRALTADEFEGCIVLNASEKPLRPAGILTRLIHPLSG